jgi:copper chaperone CopZ
MESLDLAVPTVHCTSCKLNIEESLDELRGVALSRVHLDSKQVIVTYDSAAVEPATIIAAIEDAGYPVRS